MRRAFVWTLPVLVVAALASPLACEKEIHRAARRAFQEILDRNLPPEQQAAALEELVRAYPEPKTNPNLVRAFGMLADYHARAGHPDIAASWYERAVRVNPDDPDLLNSLGYHYARNRMNLDRAVSVLESAVRLAEERRYTARRQAFIKDSLGWAYRMRGDLPLAVALLEEATRLAPGVTVIQEHLAEAYHAIGERDRAASMYLDLYLKGRGTSRTLRETLRALGREGGGAYAHGLDRRIESGLRGLGEADRMGTEAGGATVVQLEGADGQRLFGSLYRPRVRSGRGAVAATATTGGVLLLHPLGSSRAACAASAAAIASEGLWALAIDLRGHGASVSESLPDPHAFSIHLADNLDAAGWDVRAGLVFLARQPGVGAHRLGIVGGGLGALPASRAVSPDDDAVPRPAALVLLSPWGPADTYREPLARLPPDALFLVAGSEEGTALATVRDIVAHAPSGTPRSLVVEGPGAQFDLARTSPGLPGAVASFLKSRLAGPVHAAGASGHR